MLTKSEFIKMLQQSGSPLAEDESWLENYDAASSAAAESIASMPGRGKKTDGASKAP